MKRYLPLLAGVLALLYVGSNLRLPTNRTEFDTEGFGRLPVLLSGRLKPLDTVARTSLLLLQNKQRVKNAVGESLSPHQWLLDVAFKPALADTYKHFRIDNNEVLALFHLTTEDGDGGVRFSFDQLKPHLDEFEQQTDRVAQIESPQRTAYEREVMKLRERLVTYLNLRFSLQLPQSEDFAAEVSRFAEILPTALAATQDKRAGKPADDALVHELADFLKAFQFLSSRSELLAIPPPSSTADINAWSTLGDALLGAFATGEVSPPVRDYAALGHAWRAGDPAAFNRAVGDLHRDLTSRDDARLGRTALEFRFNHAEPFYGAAVLYVLCGLIAFISWLAWPALLSRCALSIGAVAWLLTSVGILARMYIESRPPVTNLYSSALFVGWVGAGLALLFERFYRNSIGNVVAGVIGFLTLVIAHNLSFSGDTMEMMRAVLDSNFWLATHVVSITMGYGACFLAGVLAIIYIGMGLLTDRLNKPFDSTPTRDAVLDSAGVPPIPLAATSAATAKKRPGATMGDALVRMVYGAVCFATLFSLVGTVLGGIWADQSWGRFWGWDPKENGALIIVIWNAIILHARWGKLVGDRGLMNLAVFGNCVTAASWFGVNMLGVGLHSYGFMDKALLGLCLWWAANLAVIGLGLIPRHLWRSRPALES